MRSIGSYSLAVERLEAASRPGVVSIGAVGATAVVAAAWPRAPPPLLRLAHRRHRGITATAPRVPANDVGPRFGSRPPTGSDRVIDSAPILQLGAGYSTAGRRPGQEVRSGTSGTTVRAAGAAGPDAGAVGEVVEQAEGDVGRRVDLRGRRRTSRPAAGTSAAATHGAAGPAGHERRGQRGRPPGAGDGRRQRTPGPPGAAAGEAQRPPATGGRGWRGGSGAARPRRRPPRAPVSGKPVAASVQAAALHAETDTGASASGWRAARGAAELP